MKLRFPALKNCHPKNFAASRRNTIAMAIVTHRPYIIPDITRLKSLAPRTSPYSVAPQFGHRIQKHRNGINSRLSPKNGEKPIFAGRAEAPPARSIVAWYAPGAAPNRRVDSESNELWNPARE